MNNTTLHKKAEKESKRSIGNILSQELNYIKQGKTRLSTDFIGSIILIIVLILIVIALSVMNTVPNLNNEVNKAKQQNRSDITNIISNTIRNNINSDDYYSAIMLLEGMIKDNVIEYGIVSNSTDKTILLSTLNNPELTNDGVSTQSLLENGKENTICIRKATGDFVLYIGFKDNKTFLEQTNTLLKNLIICLVVCLLLGIWMAVRLFKRVLKPVKEMIKVTSLFETGDLSERLEQSKYVEFDELIESYNTMADSMQKLYSTLEHNVHERTKQLQEAIKEIQETQAMMVHSEKMKSLGELVAGIMHEINNPINFIYGNLSHLKNYTNDLFDLIDEFERFKNDLTEEHLNRYNQKLEEIDYEFLKSDLPELLKSCHEGTERTKNIILNLKDFSRMEESAITNVEIPKEIDSILNILHNKFKHKITVHKEFDESVPKIEAYGGQLNQVFMNILDNAAFAVSDREHGDVWISTRKDDKYVYVSIKDNGKGMSEETKNKIFNPFFTTKPVGQGTGLGLSISYKVIQKHKGEIRVESKEGEGTTFIIKIPLLFDRSKNEENAEVING